jgi:uncharacterized protein YecT (DUF1311 family)
MRLVYLLVTVLLLLVPFSVSAEKAKKHPIDKMQEDCIKKDDSTAGMANCTYKAQDMWDKELNKNYNALMKKLSPTDREVLKSAQKKWLEFRDSEFKLIDALYSKLQGTMYIPMRASELKEIVRKRAMDLSAYLDLTGEMEPEEAK